MLSENHQDLLHQFSKNNTDYQALKQLVESIVDEQTQQLKHERDLAHDYINKAATALISLDKDGFVTLVNKHICDITGYSYDELMCHNWFELCIPPEESEEVKRIFKEVIRGEIAPSDYYENYIITKSGQRKLIAWRNNYHIDPETGDIKGSFSSGTDLTNSIQSEQLLQETQEQLITILDGIVDGVAVISSDEKILYANEAVARILGFDSTTQMIELMQDDIYIPNDPLDEDGNFLKFEDQALYQALQGHMPPPQTVIFKNKDTNTEIWTDTKSKPIFDENGRVRFAVITINDITRTRQIEQVRFELLREQAQISTLREFIANTTHDLSQPLSVINTAVYMLDKSVQHELVQKRTMIIKNQSLMMQIILKDIQEMSILDTIQDIQIDPIQSREIIDRIIDYANSLAQEKGIRFVSEINALNTLLLGDKTHLDRAIMQILQNAFDYTQEGDEIKITYTVDDTVAVLEISDTGIGIDKVHINYIFNRFYRADKSRTSGTGAGSGLGLAIAKRIIDLHSGRIEVDSILGEGSTFRIYLPIVVPSVI